jgi:hypothetical protein
MLLYLYIIEGLFAWEHSKGYLESLDKTYCSGGVGYSYIAVKHAILAYHIARDVKNAYNSTKFQVEWGSKGATRDCSICRYVFKSLTLKKEFSKHHCHSCGRVVCHACSSNKILSEISGKPERICSECLVDGGKARAAAMESGKKFQAKEKEIMEKKKKEAMEKLQGAGGAYMAQLTGQEGGSDSD